jgi:hypothetical protein
MKKLLLSISIVLISGVAFAQFGGGSGTNIDPYRIYTKSHMEELSDSLLLGNSFTGVHFDLMNDISDSLRTPVGKNNFPFNGSFHGKGHSIILGMDLRDSTQYSYSQADYCLFPVLGESAYLDSLSVSGYIFASLGLVGYNYGEINYCINNLSSPFTHDEIHNAIGYEIYSAGICKGNFGGIIQNCINFSELYGFFVGGIVIEMNVSDYQNFAKLKNCINYGDITMLNNFDSPSGGGIAGLNILGYDENRPVIIENCKNYGNILFTGNYWVHGVGGIAGYIIGNTLISNCINYGNIEGKIMYGGGIAGYINQYTLIDKCSNYGKISGENNIGGIFGLGAGFRLSNCFNSGNVSGSSYTGGIGFGIMEPTTDTIYNCLNIGHTNSSAIIANDDELEINHLTIANNFYDKQMCLNKGIADVDVPNSAEGKLTNQLTGTSPELQAMLGDGWSYAEGRYPIPLGLENDSMALVAATPVYLHFETEEEYNHVDSVSKNFTVGLENNVSWEQANGRVSFSDESVTLLSLGIENLTVSLGDYSKKVRINIVDIETSATQLTIENVISVYPNPASDYININLNGVSADKMEICDITGKVISSQIISTEHSQTNIKNLKPGLYLLKIYNKYQNVTTLRFVKN